MDSDTINKQYDKMKEDYGYIGTFFWIATSIVLTFINWGNLSFIKLIIFVLFGGFIASIAIIPCYYAQRGLAKLLMKTNTASLAPLLSIVIFLASSCYIILLTIFCFNWFIL